MLIDEKFGYEGKFVDGKLHCDDGPARVWHGETKEWYVGGKVHRIDGPAIISTDVIWWAVNGFFITSYEDYQEASGCTDADIITLKLKWGKMQYPDFSMEEDMYISLCKR